MRTTISLDDDLMHKLRERAMRKNQTLTHVINELLRSQLLPSPRPSGRFTQQTHALGSHPGIELDKALLLAAELENDYSARKMEIDK